MPDNVLQSIGLSPEWFSQVMGTVANGTPSPDQSGAPAQPPQMPMSAQEAGVPATPQDPGTPAAATPPTVPQDPAAPVNAMQGVNPAPVQPQAPQAAPPPQRHSLLDTIGKIANAFAVGGHATPQYGPQGYWQRDQVDRANALVDEQQKVDLNRLKIASNTMDNSTQQGKQIQGVAAGLQSLIKANPQNYAPGTPGAANAWGALAQRAGLDPQKAAQIFSQVQSDPNALAALASGADDGGKEKYGGNVIYATGPDGKLTAFQAGLGSNEGRNILPAGYTPVDPTKFVDAGGTQVGYGAQSGALKPGLVINKTVTPDAAAGITSRENLAAQAIAAARDRATAAAAAKNKPVDNAEIQGILSNIQNGFNDLHTMKALPGDDAGTVGNVLSAVGRTGVGQYVGEQANNAAAQKRIEVTKSLKQLQQQFIKSLPASATRSRFEQEIVSASLPDPYKMSYGTANTVLQQYRKQFGDIYSRAAAAANEEKTPTAPTAALPPRIQGTLHPAAPANGGWSIVGVH